MVCLFFPLGELAWRLSQCMFSDGTGWGYNLLKWACLLFLFSRVDKSCSPFKLFKFWSRRSKGKKLSSSSSSSETHLASPVQPTPVPSTYRSNGSIHSCPIVFSRVRKWVSNSTDPAQTRRLHMSGQCWSPPHVLHLQLLRPSQSSAQLHYFVFVFWGWGTWNKMCWWTIICMNNHLWEVI